MADESSDYLFYVNRREKNTFKFPTNYFVTSKYTIITFLPLNLFEQFRRLANIFFLFLVLVQLIPGLSPYSIVVSIMPLMFILLVTAVKEAYEDILRHMEDRKANSACYLHLVEDHYEEYTSGDIQVGDILLIKEDQQFPADLFLLSSSEKNGLTFIDTANLDGETNHKKKRALPETYTASCDFVSFEGYVSCETPNDHLNTFFGALHLPSHPNPLSIGMDQVHVLLLYFLQFLPRGAILRSTKEAYGTVIFTGKNTKLSQNLKDPVFKVSQVEKLMNKFLPSIIVIILLMCFFGAGMARLYDGDWEKQKWGFPSNKGVAFGFDFGTLFLLYSFMIPQALYVGIEICRLFMSVLINCDPDFFVRGEGGARSQTSNLNDELGQVQYIFSDKTGTLTQNIMQFKTCTIGNELFSVSVIEQLKSHSSPLKDGDPITEAFMQCLTMCNEVFPELKPETGSLIYRTESPDELALMDLAALWHRSILERDELKITISHSSNAVRHTSNETKEDALILEDLSQDGSVNPEALVSMSEIATGIVDRSSFEILALLTFTSDRKRMCIILRSAGKYYVYTKGADSMVLSLCRTSLGEACFYQSADHYQDSYLKCQESVELFAKQGYRTLVYAGKMISEEQFLGWKEEYDRIMTLLEGRDQAMNNHFLSLEREEYILGVTGVEDLLQENLFETLTSFHEAGIQFAVATGDKLETAVTIGYNSGLLTSKMKLLYLDQLSSVQEKLSQYLQEIQTAPAGSVFAVITTGEVCDRSLSDHHSLFVDLFRGCSTAVCCRMTPIQKANMVKMVRTDMNLVCLGVGDGANDVSMILEADVGVGIHGKEGKQAVNSSDYAIRKFFHLKKLLLVHGRYNYLRLVYLIYMAFYINMALFFFSFFSGHSGISVYLDVFLTFFNICFGGPIFGGIGLFLKDVRVDSLMNHPQLYRRLITNPKIFSIKNYISFVAGAVIEGVLISIIVIFSHMSNYDIFRADGTSIGFEMMGLTIASSVVFTNIVVGSCTPFVLSRPLAIIHYWDWPLLFLILFGLPLLLFGYAIDGVTMLMSSGSHWLLILLCACACGLMMYTRTIVISSYFPEDWNIIIENDVIDRKPLMMSNQNSAVDQKIHPNRGNPV